jgi:hypothetical protein
MAEEFPDVRPLTRVERLEQLKHEVATRLRPVCPKMPTEEFDRMVARVAAIELKYTYGY